MQFQNIATKCMDFLIWHGLFNFTLTSYYIKGRFNLSFSGFYLKFPKVKMIREYEKQAWKYCFSVSLSFQNKMFSL